MRFVCVITLLSCLVSIPVFSQRAQSRIDRALTDSSTVSKQTDTLQTRSLDSTVLITNEIYLDDSTASQLLVLKNNIYIATINGIIYCLDQSMQTKWQYRTEGKISNSILGTGDLVVVMTDAGDLFTINANNGDLVQSIGIGEPINSNIIFTDIEYNSLKTKGVIFGTTYGNIYCYELYSLEQVWENSLEETNVITGTFLINDKIIVQTENENYYCLESDNGVLTWKWKPGTKSEKQNFKSDVVSKDNSIFIIDSDGNLYSIDLLLGTENWNKKKINASGSLYIINKDLILHSTKNRILFVDPNNSRTKNEIKLPDGFSSSTLTFVLENNKENLLGFSNGLICKLTKKNDIEPILYTGNSPVISLIKQRDNSFLSVNRDGKLIEFRIN